MQGFRIPGSRHFGILTALLAVVVSLCGSSRAPGQTNDKIPATGPQNEPSFQLKIASNLVVVRVVVRDAQGKPVENLKKEDFKLFDRGKEQTITQFAVETSTPPPTTSVVVRVPEQSTPPPPLAMPGKFLVLYFDDLNTSDADMIQVRDAADHYMAANVRPQDRVAIFTSEQMLSDFTSDPKEIHEALFKLHAGARALDRAHYCPDLSDYQALEITQSPNNDAWEVAMDEAAHCDMGILKPDGGADPAFLRTMIRGLAQNIVNQAEILARSNLQQLEQAVEHISQMPGQRTVILVSPGFLSQSEQYQLDHLIDDALRSQVVISALDPKGLAILMREADASRSYIPGTNPRALAAAHRMDSERELVVTGVLADVAQSTGGEYFHSSNDLKAGFGALTGSPLYYILAFPPSDIKQDGKFHALKVTLAEKQEGLRIHARRGYFAPKQ